MAIRALPCALAVSVRTRRRAYGRDSARRGPPFDCGYAPARAVRCRQALPVLGLPLISLVAAAIRQGNRSALASAYYLAYDATCNGGDDSLDICR